MVMLSWHIAWHITWGGNAEGAFFQVGVKLVLIQGVQNLLNILQVFGPSLVVNENFI